MDVVTSGVLITAKNTLRRLRQIFVNIIMRAGHLLLKLPLASIRFLSFIGSYLLDGKNKKVVAIILTTAALMIASRTLVSQANRKRMHRESSKLFSRFHTRFASRLNLIDADDEELLKAAHELEQYLKARHGRPLTLQKLEQLPEKSTGQQLRASSLKGTDRMMEIESTVSGGSREVDVRRL